jgi:ubiquinone/menaquinone biosynthesis C-methylase UbiE
VSDKVSDKTSGNNCCDFVGNYELSRLPAIKKLEQSALGCDYGGTSWTTREQVNDIIASLNLQPNCSLLEVGAGSGWPGLLLGKLAECNVTLLDMPLNALQQAAERAASDSMSDQVCVVAGSGTALPFANAAFDCISHSDVLCCLPEKLELLHECRRVASHEARMHFSVILPTPDISADEHAEVIETGPPFVGVAGDYAEMLQVTGWHSTQRLDVSTEYQLSLQRLVDGMRANEKELARVLGKDDLVARRQHREDQISLIKRGLLLRETFVASAMKK